MQSKEIWKRFRLSANVELSSLGNVRRIHTRGHRVPMSYCVDNKGYARINYVCAETGSKKSIQLHRAIAMTFVKGFKPGLHVNHVDGIKLNNNPKNLEWCSAKKNVIHAFDNGLSRVAEEHPRATLTNKAVHRICKALAKGKSPELIASKHNIRVTVVLQIKNGLSWRTISDLYFDFPDTPKQHNPDKCILDASQIKEIRQRYQKEKRRKPIALDYGVSTRTISNVVNKFGVYALM